MATTYEDNLESFTIKFRREIVFYLRQLINDGERVSVTFAEGSETMLTVLLDVNEEDSTLIFDWGGSATINRKLMESKRAIFVASPQGVRNQFVTQRVWETTYKKRPAFATKIPDEYVRLQRREFFRLLLPMMQRPPCRFETGDPAKAWEFSVVDIGLGGLGMEIAAASVPFGLGQTITRAEIMLGKTAKLTVDLEIRFVGNVSRGNRQLCRLGCHFVKVSQAQENELQRFITQVQREERAKLG